MNSNSDDAVSSLRQMQQQMTQWMKDKPQFDGGNELRLQPGDLAIFQFMSNGDDGFNLLKVYRSHIIPRVANTGTRYNETRYCPVQSGDVGVECPLCTQGHAEVKERMSIWMFVTNILHVVMPKDKQFPTTKYEGNMYFNEELSTEGHPGIGAFRIWHSSAWRDSPWTTILKLGELYHGLHNFTAQLIRTGTGTGTRYNVVAIPNSAMVTPELYARAIAECHSIPQMLANQISSTVEVAPNANNQGVQTGTVLPESAAVPFNAPGIQVPTLQVPSLDTAAPPPATDDVIRLEDDNVGEYKQVELPQVVPPSITETPPPSDDEKRPLRSLF
jgi:hypothetical protein